VNGLPSKPRKNFEENLALARAGSRTAFDRLIMPYRVALRRLARERLEQRLQSKISDSDLFQIASLQAFENLGQFRGNTFEEFGSWVLVIMDHTVSSQNRRYHRPGRDIAREVPLETVRNRLLAKQAKSEEEEARQRLKAGLDKLPETHRKVLVWRYYEKKSYQEIGKLVGVSADAAKHLCYRALGRLGDEVRNQSRA
jgi:RNA polymerase sigma-70 factor (subfamily 1)